MLLENFEVKVSPSAVGRALQDWPRKKMRRIVDIGINALQDQVLLQNPPRGPSRLWGKKMPVLRNTNFAFMGQMYGIQMQETECTLAETLESALLLGFVSKSLVSEEQSHPHKETRWAAQAPALEGSVGLAREGFGLSR